MPRGRYSETEKRAVEIVRQGEIERGWEPSSPLGQHAQHEEGCDLLSVPPGGGAADAIEIKGWGEPLLRPDGSFTYPADVNAEQLQRAARDPKWRLEIVANLDAVDAGTGEFERLTLSAQEVVARAVCWRYRVALDGLADRIKRAS